MSASVDPAPPSAALTPVAGLVAVGAAAGVLSGLFGVGGGILMVPAMVILLAFGQQRAQATSLAAVVPIALVGAIVFGRADSVNVFAAAMLIVGSVIGVQVGARLMHRLSDDRLSLIFGCFLAAVAVSLLLP